MQGNARAESLARIKGAHVVVLGDVILDIFTTVQRERPSSEHRKPGGEEGWNLQQIGNSIKIPGGAGNTARNIATLGGKATLISVAGVGESADTLQRILEEHDIVVGLLNDRERRTSVKYRTLFPDGTYAADVLNRDTVDEQGQPIAITQATELRVIERLAETQSHTVVITDNGRGFITPGLIRGVVGFCQSHGRKLIYDIRPRGEDFDFSVVTEAYLITPNRKEAAQLLGVAPLTNGKDSVEACRELAMRFNTNVLLTQDGDGMLLYIRDSGEHYQYPALGSKVICVSGAGDTVAATIALATEAGATLKEAVEWASHSAAIAVAKDGTAVVNFEELALSLANGTGQTEEPSVIGPTHEQRAMSASTS